MEFLVQQRFLVNGMTCAACARSVESLLQSTDGVASASVNFGTNSATVEYNSAEVSSHEFHDRLQPFGYDLLPAARESEQTLHELKLEHLKALKRRTIVAVIISVPLMVLGMSMTESMGLNILQCLLSAIVLGYAGRDFFMRSAHQIISWTLSMDSLVALSTGLAFIWSSISIVAHDQLMEIGVHTHLYFESASIIIAFVLLGKYLEERAKQHSSSALDSLRALQPRTVMLIRGTQSVEAPIELVRRGDVVLIRPGERVSVDGVVVEGQSYCDESMLSGESAPLLKEVTSMVYAGTLNQSGALQVQARSVQDDTMLAFIQRSVLEAQDSRIAAQRLVDFVSSKFVPAVIIISILSFIGWMVFGGVAAVGPALTSMIAVLIVACPCALGLAAPIALVVGIGRAAQNGILIKSAESLEQACAVTDIIFDKTGTLSDTESQHIDLSFTVDAARQKELLDILYSIESQSQHPYARAVVRTAEASQAKRVELSHCEEIIGKGMKATYKGINYALGSVSFIRNEYPALQISEANNKAILFAHAGEVLCQIRVSTELRPGVQEMIANLHAMHITPHIVSGDTDESVQEIARAMGIKHTQSQSTSSAKEHYLQALQSESKVVAMVGDGINDAQSLARADVSFAMGRGSDTAMNASHMVLMNSDITRIIPALRLSRQTLHIIKQNLAWAFVYNIILIPLASGILVPWTGLQLDPMLAGAAMALSSVSVVGNSLRLKRVVI